MSRRWLMLVLSILPMLAAAAEPAALGRLFLTPAERAALDVVRQNSRPPEKIITPEDASRDEEDIDGSTAPVATPPVVTIHGYVKRTDGKGTVWVNGQPMREKSAAKDVEVGKLQGNTNDVQIKLPNTGKTVKLKAGQSYDPGSGKVGSLREIVPLVTPAVGPATEEAAKGSTPSTKNPLSADKAASPSAPATPPAK